MASVKIFGMACAIASRRLWARGRSIGAESISKLRSLEPMKWLRKMDSPWITPDRKFEVTQFLNTMEDLSQRLSVLTSATGLEIVLDDETFNGVVIALLGELDTLRAYDMDLHLAHRRGQFRHQNVVVKSKRMANASPWNKPDAGGDVREHPAQQWDR